MSSSRKCVFIALVLLGASAWSHPLDPLSADEIKAASSVLAANDLLGNGWFLQELSLREPQKKQVMAGDRKRLPRQAGAVLVNLAKNQNLECVIDLDRRSVVSQTPIVVGQPAMMDNELGMIEAIVRADPRFEKAMKARGVQNLHDVHVEPWGSGDVRAENVDNSHRLFRSLFYFRGATKNPYARPIEGVSVIVDMTAQKVVQFIDNEMKPISTKPGDFFKEMGPEAKLVSNLAAGTYSPSTQIKVNGHEVAWKDWRFHVGVHFREGMVISMLSYNDHGKLRPILYKGALSEMVVPYADPSRHWYWRAAFDQGEYSVGPNTHSLTPGVHAPAEAHFFDVTMSTSDGSARTIPNGLAVFERDSGILWSHMDFVTGDVAAKRGKELVALHMFTVGNYDYALQWIFKEDGVVEVQTLLTGIIAVKGGNAEQCERCKAKLVDTVYTGKLEDDFGTVVDQNLIGITHEHFFNFRLDFSVDGNKNSVAEISFEKMQDKEKNPHGNMFVLNKKILNSELDGGRDANDAIGRRWVVFNPNIKNRLGHYPGYAIVPGPSATPLQEGQSKIAEQAEFLKHHLWVTRYDPAQRNIAGAYPNQNPGDGVTHWVARDANINNEDIVAWYTIGLVHLPCPEDWPVMPVTKAGFALKPMGFFTQNPTVNLQEEAVMAQK